MALIANTIVQLTPEPSVNYILGQDKILGSNIKAAKFVDVSKDKINSKAAAVRPLVKDPVAYPVVEEEPIVRVKTIETVTAPTPTPIVTVDHKIKVVGRSRYMSDMLTVE